MQRYIFVLTFPQQPISKLCNTFSSCALACQLCSSAALASLRAFHRLITPFSTSTPLQSTIPVRGVCRCCFAIGSESSAASSGAAPLPTPSWCCRFCSSGVAGGAPGAVAGAVRLHQSAAPLEKQPKTDGLGACWTAETVLWSFVLRAAGSAAIGFGRCCTLPLLLGGR